MRHDSNRREGIQRARWRRRLGWLAVYITVGVVLVFSSDNLRAARSQRARAKDAGSPFGPVEAIDGGAGFEGNNGTAATATSGDGGNSGAREDATTSSPPSEAEGGEAAAHLHVPLSPQERRRKAFRKKWALEYPDHDSDDGTALAGDPPATRAPNRHDAWMKRWYSGMRVDSEFAAAEHKASRSQRNIAERVFEESFPTCLANGFYRYFYASRLLYRRQVAAAAMRDTFIRLSDPDDDSAGSDENLDLKPQIAKNAKHVGDGLFNGGAVARVGSVEAERYKVSGRVVPVDDTFWQFPDISRIKAPEDASELGNNIKSRQSRVHHVLRQVQASKKHGIVISLGNACFSCSWSSVVEVALPLFHTLRRLDLLGNRDYYIFIRSPVVATRRGGISAKEKLDRRKARLGGATSTLADATAELADADNEDPMAHLRQCGKKRSRQHSSVADDPLFSLFLGTLLPDASYVLFYDEMFSRMQAQMAGVAVVDAASQSKKKQATPPTSVFLEHVHFGMDRSCFGHSGFPIPVGLDRENTSTMYNMHRLQENKPIQEQQQQQQQQQSKSNDTTCSSEGGNPHAMCGALQQDFARHLRAKLGLDNEPVSRAEARCPRVVVIRGPREEGVAGRAILHYRAFLAAVAASLPSCSHITLLNGTVSEVLNTTDRIALINRATIMVAPRDSTNTNLVFMRPGSAVVLLSGVMWERPVVVKRGNFPWYPLPYFRDDVVTVLGMCDAAVVGTRRVPGTKTPSSSTMEADPTAKHQRHPNCDRNALHHCDMVCAGNNVRAYVEAAVTRVAAFRKYVDASATHADHARIPTLKELVVVPRMVYHSHETSAVSPPPEGEVGAAGSSTDAASAGGEEPKTKRRRRRPVGYYLVNPSSNSSSTSFS